MVWRRLSSGVYFIRCQNSLGCTKKTPFSWGVCVFLGYLYPFIQDFQRPNFVCFVWMLAEVQILCRCSHYMQHLFVVVVVVFSFKLFFLHQKIKTCKMLHPHVCKCWHCNMWRYSSLYLIFHSYGIKHLSRLLGRPGI